MNKYFKIFNLLIVLFILIFLFQGCTTRSYKKTIELYVKNMKNENFKYIQENLLYGTAKEKFHHYLSEMALDQVRYNTVIDTFKNIKKIIILQEFYFDNNEMAVKFQFVNKEGVPIETAYWRFKKIGSKYYVIKFSKH